MTSQPKWTPADGSWKLLKTAKDRHEELARANSGRAGQYLFDRNHVGGGRMYIAQPSKVYADPELWQTSPRKWMDKPEWPHVQWCTVQWQLFPPRGEFS